MNAFLLSWLLFFHPYFVSVVEIDHNAKAQELEVSIRIFTDDLEVILQQKFPNQKVDLIKNPQPALTDTLISRYVRSRFHLQVDGKPVNLQYVGQERIEESNWCYFEVQKQPVPKRIHVSNQLLYDYKKEQVNMHIVKVNGKELTRKLDNPESEWDFNF